MSSNLLKNKFNLLFLILFVFLFFYFFSNTTQNFSNEFEPCNRNLGISKTNYEIISEDLYLSKDFNNIFCLGKIIKFYESDENNGTLVIGSNPKVKELLEISSIFLLLLILFTKKHFLHIVSLITTFNIYFLYLLTNPENTFFFFIYEHRYFLLGFLLLLNIKNTNIYIFIFSFYFFFFIEYQYFGIFIFIIYLFNQFKYKVNNVSSNLLKLTSLIFLSSRYLSGYYENLYNYWSTLSPHNYLNTIRFWDIQWFLAKLNCNINEGLNYNYNYSSLYFNCPNQYSYGPLSDLIGIRLNIWNLSLMISLISICILYFFYIKLFNYYLNEKIFLTILLISPPMNFLLDRINFDLIILLIVSYLLYKNKTVNTWRSFILLFLSGIKLHTIGSIVGIIFFSIKNKLKKLISISISSLISLVLLITFVRRYLGNSEISRASREDLAYGVLVDSQFISNQLSININIIYISIVLLIASISLILFIRNKDEALVFSDNEILFFSLSTWFLITTLYENYAYRYPIFFLLFFLTSIKSNKNTKTAILGMILLAPFPVVNTSIQMLIFLIHRVFHYSVVVFLSSQLLKKIFTPIENNEQI